MVSVDGMILFIMARTVATPGGSVGAEMQTGVSIGCHGKICLKGAEKSTSIKNCVGITKATSYF